MNNFMNNLKYKLQRFMIGRYGVDELYRYTIGFAFVLLVLNMFMNFYVINLLVWGLFAWSLFRVFSKNIYKRRMENNKFIKKIKTPLKAKIKLISRKHKDRKTHRYLHCPSCKTTLRIPKKSKNLKVKCPKCGNTFYTKTKSK